VTKFSKKCVMALVLVFVLSLVVGCQGGNTESSPSKEPAKQTEIIIGTAGSGGTWYVMGSGIANLVSKYNPDIKMTSSSTHGTVENMRLVGEKRIDVGMTQPPADNYAFNGIELFDGKPEPNLRFMCGGHYSIGQIAVPVESDIKSIADLKGRKVAIGVPGSGVRHFVGRGLLRLGGLDLDQIEIVSLNQSQSADALQDGSVEAAVFSGGIPVAGLVNLSMVKEVRILPVPPEAVEKMKKIDPPLGAALKSVTIPAGSYKGQDEDVSACGFITAFTTRDDVPEDIVYKILKTINEHQDELTEVHPSGKEYTLETLASGCGIPPHPGSVRFFKENGITLKDPTK